MNNAKVPKPGEARNEIDRLRAELQGDFRSALRHAYLGPRCRLTAALYSEASLQGCWKSLSVSCGGSPCRAFDVTIAANHC